MTRTAAALVCLAMSSPASAEPTLPEVLARAGEYVVAFHQQLAGIVAEERYTQHATTPGRRPLLMAVVEHRELVSDLLLVKPPGSRDWMQFRDVFEVDGLAVRDRTDRLTRLFVEPSARGNAQIETILNESARYNIGTIERTVNVPVIPLIFLRPENQKRFTFKRADGRTDVAIRETPGTASNAFHVAEEVWAISFQEKERPTFIRTTAKRPLPSKGRFWIEPATGRVLMTELILESRDVRATIDVSYQSEPLLGFFIPIEMRERYDGRRDKAHIEGTATYGRFRQFQVNTNESFVVRQDPED
jgi:hypothetical protein